MYDKFRVWAEVDLQRLGENYQSIRRALPGAVSIMGVVKADAYGHGAVAVGRCLERAGIDALGVGDSIEALELREAGIETPIYILGALAGAELERIVALDIIPPVNSAEVVAWLAREAERQNKVVQVNVIIDTGMGRLGIKPGEALGILKTIQDTPHLRVESLSTHFPSASLGDRDFTNFQIAIFKNAIDAADKAGIAIPNRHAANTSALFAMKESWFNMVRPGIGLYGINPGNLDMAAIGLQPALRLKSQIVYIKNVRAGTSISYHRTFFTTRSTKIATIPVGYNDGYRVAFSNKVDVIVNGRRCPQVGRVTMDYTMIDLGPNSREKVGDEVILIGDGGGQAITVEDLAEKGGTIPYEITTGLGKRVKRIYSGDAAPAGRGPVLRDAAVS